MLGFRVLVVRKVAKPEHLQRGGAAEQRGNPWLELASDLNCLLAECMPRLLVYYLPVDSSHEHAEGCGGCKPRVPAGQLACAC